MIRALRAFDDFVPGKRTSFAYRIPQSRKYDSTFSLSFGQMFINALRDKELRKTGVGKPKVWYGLFILLTLNWCYQSVQIKLQIRSMAVYLHGGVICMREDRRLIGILVLMLGKDAPVGFADFFVCCYAHFRVTVHCPWADKGVILMFVNPSLNRHKLFLFAILCCLIRWMDVAASVVEDVFSTLLHRI